VTVLYKGSVSDQFRADREVSVKGELRNGVFVARKDSLVTKCPSKYTAKKS
jgi:cytochrome c-type biogenesis protein CcmE